MIMLTKEIQYSFLCPECGLIHLSNIGYKEECQQNVCSDQNYLNFCLGLPLNIGSLHMVQSENSYIQGLGLKAIKNTIIITQAGCSGSTSLQNQ